MHNWPVYGSDYIHLHGIQTQGLSHKIFNPRISGPVGASCTNSEKSEVRDILEFQIMNCIGYLSLSNALIYYLKRAFEYPAPRVLSGHLRCSINTE